MKDRLLTTAELKAIRTMPCGQCRHRPPYPDGSWTQKHRIKPGGKGGRYTLKNTVPRCPSCHSKAPGHHRGWITLSPSQRREAGLKGAPKGRRLSPQHRHSISIGLKGKPQPWKVGANNPMKRPEVRAKNSAAQSGDPLKLWFATYPKQAAKNAVAAGRKGGRTRAKTGVRDALGRFCTRN